MKKKVILRRRFTGQPSGGQQQGKQQQPAQPAQPAQPPQPQQPSTGGRSRRVPIIIIIVGALIILVCLQVLMIGAGGMFISLIAPEEGKEIPQEFVAGNNEKEVVEEEVDGNENEEEILDSDDSDAENSGSKILDSDVTFVEKEEPEVTDDGSKILDPDVTFTSEEVPAQIETTGAKKKEGGVLISYRWINAPDDSSYFHGEAWDWFPGQEEMIFSETEERDTGTIFVPVSDWEKVSHARILVSGQQWEACGGLIPIE